MLQLVYLLADYFSALLAKREAKLIQSAIEKRSVPPGCFGRILGLAIGFTKRPSTDILRLCKSGGGMPVQNGNHRQNAHLRALCSISLLFAVVTDRSQAAQPSIKGLDPSLSAKYKPKSGRFACFDGSSDLAFDRVNDNFCDCIDGSDEPGKLHLGRKAYATGLAIA